MATPSLEAATFRIQIYEALKDKEEEDLSEHLFAIFSRQILPMIEAYEKVSSDSLKLDFRGLDLRAPLDSKMEKILKKHFPDLKILLLNQESLENHPHRLRRITELNFTELHFSECPIDDNSLQHIAKMKKLETLDLLGCEALTDQGLAELSDCQLISVTLGSAQITHQGVNYLGNPSLRSLTLVNCNVDLSKLGAFEGLEELVLVGPYTKEQIDQLPEFPNLKKLDIDHCPNAKKTAETSTCTIS